MGETQDVGLLSAMLAVQGEAPTLPKNVENTFYKSKYTPLDTIVETVGPLLFKNGLVWTALPSRDEHGDPSLKYRLSHAPSGEKLEGEMQLLLSKQDAQGQGSAITYARRYALCAVLNLVADDDDDGQRAATGSAQAPRQQGSGEATAPQKKLLRTLITQNRLDEPTMRRLFASVSFVLNDGEKVNDAIERLPKAACSQLIEQIKEGPVPTGQSDVPADSSGFSHPPEQDPLPVS